MTGIGSSTGTVDVAIVGAGPTGLMAAGLLTRMGLRIRIVDKSAGPAKESRAMVVQARSLELFLAMGIVEPFLDQGFVVNGARVVVDGREAVELAFDDIGRVDTPFAFPLMIPQSETEKILLDDLSGRGVAVEYGVTVTGLEQSETGVTLTTATAGGGTIEAAYVIGADGAHSIVRKALGLRFDGAAYPKTFCSPTARSSGRSRTTGSASSSAGRASRLIFRREESGEDASSRSGPSRATQLRRSKRKARPRWLLKPCRPSFVTSRAQTSH